MKKLAITFTVLALLASCKKTVNKEKQQEELLQKRK